MIESCSRVCVHVRETMMGKNGRDRHGRFAAGNPGGPGRPRRLVEADYLARISETISSDDWRRIVEKAKDDAINGDWRARAWLSVYLVGREPDYTLFELAVREQSGKTLDDDIESKALGLY